MKLQGYEIELLDNAIALAAICNAVMDFSNDSNESNFRLVKRYMLMLTLEQTSFVSFVNCFIELYDFAKNYDVQERDEFMPLFEKWQEDYKCNLRVGTLTNMNYLLH